MEVSTIPLTDAGAAQLSYGIDPHSARLQVSGLTLARENREFAIPDFSVQAGEVTAIVGPSGSGKTTALMALSLMHRPVSGTVLIDSGEPWKLRRHERDAFRGQHIGLIFQSFHLVDALTVRSNIALGARCAGKDIDPQRIDYLLAPADGSVMSGSSSVDTASITGESVPIDVAAGADVFNGSINLDGLLNIRVSRVGGETTLGRVIALMQEAENIKPAVTRLLERYAGGYMAFVLLLTACLWFLTGSTFGALAVLVASFPCALVLAAPATSIAAIAVASRHGILVKGSAFLEQLANVDAIVFDKTGTLTLGELRLVATAPAAGISGPSLIRLAGTLGSASSHPVSRAVGLSVSEGDRLPIVDFKETRGLGITGILEGETVALGRAALFESLGIRVPAPPADHMGPVAGVSRGGLFWGWVLLADQVRPEAENALKELRSLGLDRQLMVTGDRWVEAERVARNLQISDVKAEALPDEKMEFVLGEGKRGYRTMVVGDGINDALALKVGAVGVAMGARGTDVALASADLVLMTNDLRRLGTCVRLSRRCRRTILVNVGVGLGWTAIVIGIAASGTFGASGALVAAVLHNAGTLAVMANAGRLLRFQDKPALSQPTGA